MPLTRVEHRPPVLHASRTSASTLLERLARARRGAPVLDRSTWMWMKLSRAAGAGGRRCATRRAAVALDGEDRMHDQAHVEPPLGQFAHHRVDQERHVVVDDLDDRDRLAVAGVRQRRRVSKRIFGAPGLRSRRKAVSARRPASRARRRRSAAGPPARRGRTAARRNRRHVARRAVERPAGLLEQVAGGAVVVARRDIGGHGRPRARAGESVEAEWECSQSAGGRREQHTRSGDPLVTRPRAAVRFLASC